MIVVDANIVATALSDDGDSGERVRRRLLRERRLSAPELLDMEVLSTLRGRFLGGHLSEFRARAAVRDLVDLPVRRMRHAGLQTRTWALRDNLSAYDAVYVALAESLDVPLLTGDQRLARAPRIRCEVEVLTT